MEKVFRTKPVQIFLQIFYGKFHTHAAKRFSNSLHQQENKK